MRKLLDEITIKRPKSCGDCPFLRFEDGDEYCMDIELYHHQVDVGVGNPIKFINIMSPEDAMKLIYFKGCKFIDYGEEK